MLNLVQWYKKRKRCSYIVLLLSTSIVTVSMRIFKFLINQIVCVIHCVTTLSNHVNTDNILRVPTMIIVASCLFFSVLLHFSINRRLTARMNFTLHTFYMSDRLQCTHSRHKKENKELTKSMLKFVGEHINKKLSRGKQKKKRFHLNVIGKGMCMFQCLYVCVFFFFFFQLWWWINANSNLPNQYMRIRK